MKIAKMPLPAELSTLAVQGFKSLVEPAELELRPLNILAGANSSGKSSIIQPILLLKQTLEAPYDPGALLLSDSHVRFTSPDQLLSKGLGVEHARSFSVDLGLSTGVGVTSVFRQRRDNNGFDLERTNYKLGAERFEIAPGMTISELSKVVVELVSSSRVLSAVGKVEVLSGFGERVFPRVSQRRCFLEVEIQSDLWTIHLSELEATEEIARVLKEIIHVPGLRGNPLRTYPTSAVGRAFPGTFENYVASVLTLWQEKGDSRLDELGESLRLLGLTWKVRVQQVNATESELRVGRLPSRRRGGAQDLVSIADVGLGVSQTLPVLVALLAARGQLVYLEQPEIHLHPRAQVALADILLEAAQRGVIVVAETHSALLLLALQTRVAQGGVDPDLIRLNWFRRRDDGVTEITSGQLDESGAYGDWPEDFGSVIMEAESRYLDAAEAAVRRR